MVCSTAKPNNGIACSKSKNTFNSIYNNVVYVMIIPLRVS